MGITSPSHNPHYLLHIIYTNKVPLQHTFRGRVRINLPNDYVSQNILIIFAVHLKSSTIHISAERGIQHSAHIYPMNDFPTLPQWAFPAAKSLKFNLNNKHNQ